jgi:phenylalanyl-tRNA synthetase beta chain
MSLSGILENHPKGKQYGEIFENREFLPLFVDQKGKVLSFPPIINSREAGEVHPGDRELMVEVTGTDLRLVNLVLNILATNFFDRGGRVEPVTVSYPYQTVLGKRVLFPCTVDSPMIVDLKEISKILGESLKPVEVSRALESYGHTVTRMTGDKFKVSTSPYRDDILHPVDLIEDVAMSIGYENFKPELPKDFSRGSLSGEEKFSDKIRDYFVGAGFQEMISNILTSREDLVDKMRLDYHNLPLVEIDNVMTAQFSIVRNQILPSLLRVESSSGKSFYPHHIFEIGEIAEKNISMNIGSKTRIHLAALTSHMNASFSEMHSCLDLFFYYFIGKEGRTYELKATDHPSYIPGRHGEIYLKIEGRGGKEIRIGEIGEIHPEVLDRWQIGVPCSALILDVESLLPFSFSFS